MRHSFSIKRSSSVCLEVTVTHVIFVHGTGVREPAFTSTFDAVRVGMSSVMPELEIHPCFWGERLGSDLHRGLSIPLYDEARAAPGDVVLDEAAQWALLYDDPLIELRLLAAGAQGRPAVMLGPNAAVIFRDALVKLKARVAAESLPTDAPPALRLPPDAVDVLVLWDRVEFDRAVLEGVHHDPRGTQRLEGIRELAARAITAEWIRQTLVQGGVPCTGEQRDAMVEAIVNALGGGEQQAKGIGADLVKLVTAPIKSVAKAMIVSPSLRATTWSSRVYRHTLFNLASPNIGDILLYQGRGDAIRALIAETVEQIANDGEPVVLLAHSLGGIACMDLLIQRNMSVVKAVITVGSQAPYFYEIGALTQLRYDDPLPRHVPRWLNIYDRNDLLSFIAGKVLTGDPPIEDIEISSGQPFPASHSAYWRNPQTWDAVATFLRRTGL
ncbi:alpha/beta fold hydrolase [Paraburkholderia caribensis]|uniref:Alpha/beta fold hydrolase n=1 Tax=Paraburkholderia caribensis TaxID=75105 RepID=A0ABV0DP82_9BURK